MVITNSSPTAKSPELGLKLTDEIVGVTASIQGVLPATGDVVHVLLTLEFASARIKFTGIVAASLTAASPSDIV